MLVFLQAERDFVPCSEFMRSGHGFARCSDLSHDLKLVSLRINAALKAVDPDHYERADALRSSLESKFPFVKAMNANDPLVYEGRWILFNIQRDVHVDRQDPPLSWAADLALGQHKGGHLFLPQLGLRIRFEPGDMIMFRGRMLRHGVENWTGGQRISMPHFTHSSTWRMMNMGSLVGLTDLEGNNDDSEVDDG